MTISLSNAEAPVKHRLDGRWLSRYSPVAVKVENKLPKLEEGVEIKDVVGYEGLYKVTDDGRVWSVPRRAQIRGGGFRWTIPRWLKPTLMKNGYLAVTLCRGANDQKTHHVHKLMAEAFLTPISGRNFVDHVDRDKENNLLENLRITTNSANCHNTNAKGYCFDKQTGRWMAAIKVNYKRQFLGRFDTPEEARAAYVEAKQKLGVPNF